MVLYYIILYYNIIILCRSQWPRGLRRRSSAARLLRLWFRIPPGVWMLVCCECCVLSGRGLCDGLITRPEESYRLWRVVVCDQETSKTRKLKPATGLWKYNHSGLEAQENKQTIIIMWYHRRICGPSLTEKSLCGAYLYLQIISMIRSEGIWKTITNLFNARHPDVLLKTIKIYKYRQNTTKFFILYHFWTTCFDSLESSSGPLVNWSKTI